MDDRMLHEYRREPDPRFASDLRERLRRHERPRALPSPRAIRIVAAVAAAATVTVIFAVPSVRVSAQAVLDVFRVRRFAAIEFKESRRDLLASYQVDAALMALAQPNALFMHCLPAHRGEEVAADVIDGPRSVVFDQAENRLHAQKGILAWCLG